MTITALNIAAACRKRGIKTVAARAEPSDTDSIDAAMREIFDDGQPHMARSISRLIGCDTRCVQKRIAVMVRDGVIRKVKHGLYALAEGPER